MYILVEKRGVYMGKKTLNCLFTLAAVILFSSQFIYRNAGPVYAQGAGKYAAEWLKIGVGARATGMGESYAAVVDDASGIFWNPAGLSRVKKTQLMLQYGMWLADTSYHAVSFLQPLGLEEEGTIGIGITYLDNGKIRRTTDLSSTELPESEADYFEATSYCSMISYSQFLGESISVGLTAKTINETIDTQPATAAAVDAGLLFTTDGKFALGVVIQNIGVSLNGSKLPLNIKTGVKIESGSTIISADVNRTDGSSMKMSAGLEFNSGETMAFRCGYLMGMDDVGEGGIVPPGITIGFGVKTESINLDLALVGWGALGYKAGPLEIPMRISLLFEF